MVLVHVLVHFDCGCNVEGGSEENGFHYEFSLLLFNLIIILITRTEGHSCIFGKNDDGLQFLTPDKTS